MNTAQYQKTICSYCGCGCRLNLLADNSKVTRIFQDDDDPVSNGNACIKGLTLHESLNTNRILFPSYRPVKSRGLVRCSWEKAYKIISKELKNLEQYDDNGIADLIYFVADGQSTNEFNYLFSKLIRSVYHSNNIDSCARLCHQGTSVAFESMTGVPAITQYSMDDLALVDCFLMVGTDPAEDYPVMFNRILEAKKSGAKLISVDVTATTTTQLSDININLVSEGIVPFVCWFISKFIESDKISRDSKLFEGFQDLKEWAKGISQKNKPSSFGIKNDQMEKIYEYLLKAKKVGICFGMGAVQHTNGTQNAQALIALGFLLNAVVFPNRGKVNVQGAGDVGGSPNWDSSRIINWDQGYRNHKGKILTEALYDKEIKFIWSVGGDLSQSMPDLNYLDESFRHKFIIYQGHHPSRIMDFASVVLPTAMISEESGTVTNGERRVRGVINKIPLQGDIKSGIDIISGFAEYAGIKGFGYKNVQDITREIIEIVPGYEKLSLENIYSDTGDFADKKPKFHKFEKIRNLLGHFNGDGNYPFTFTTSRNKFQFCTGNESRNSKSLLKLAGNQLVFMNTEDMEYLGIADGQKIRIISQVGEIETKVYKNSDVLKRTVVAQYHFPKLLVNRLTPVILDPKSGTPCYKDVPVRIDVLL